MKKLTAILALLFAAGLTAGCNTMSGLGKDIERGGEKMQDSARNAQQK